MWHVHHMLTQSRILFIIGICVYSADMAATSSDDKNQDVYDKVAAVGPFRFAGLVVAGFKRGSKLLGFPTGTIAMVP